MPVAAANTQCLPLAIVRSRLQLQFVHVHFHLEWRKIAVVNGDNCKVNKIYEYSVYEHTRSLCHSDTVWHTVYIIYKDCTGS